MRRNHGGKLLLAALLVAASGQPEDAAGQAPGAGSQRVAIIDPNGFEQPMPSMWVELPAGWQTQGGVLWDQGAPCGATPSLRWQAHSPDGQQWLSVNPAEAWTWDNLGFPPSAGSCPRQPITSVRQYLESWIQRHRPGVRILDYRPRPDLVRHPPPPDGAGTRWRKEGGEFLIAYAVQGGEVRESVAAVVQFSEMSLPGPMPGEVNTFLTGFAAGATTLRAPAGRLELGLLDRFTASAQVDPQWQARMDRHNQGIARQNMDGLRRRGQIAADSRREISDMQMQAWRERQEAMDRSHQRTMDVVTETTRYHDPSLGGPVRLDGYGDNAWRGNDGSYLHSDDPNFDPNRDLGIEADPLERIE